MCLSPMFSVDNVTSHNGLHSQLIAGSHSSMGHLFSYQKHKGAEKHICQESLEWFQHYSKAIMNSMGAWFQFTYKATNTSVRNSKQICS